MAGWPGSCTDSMVYKNMGQYLLADSAYPLNEHLIPAYRAPAANAPINAKFNYCLAKSRVRNEHMIGILKGRWASLREMRLHLNGREDIQPYMEWIKSCCIPHNMLSQIEDSWLELDNEVHQEMQQRHATDAPTANAIDLQRRLKESCVGHNYVFGLLPIR
ncbi:hypothetical protein O181_030361 [Austropuccinia psidii MF-1]|uniref:DDE Tnp4 domain-containing protein n=1 Tax=Austropuccinia psidii MF-1 TaxID=1389203 RepID=A0A9Q3H473_9BASI|nr:hypothetical protein [Austropuccinia psidii MF-1]